MNIYNSGIGDELINPKNFNLEVENYLTEEEKLTKSISMNFKIIVEAGCMFGRNAKLVQSLGLNYIGIDIENRYIIEAKQIFSNYKNVDFFCDDIINLESILSKYKIQNKGNLVVIFPFNSFGNISENMNTLEVLLSKKYNLIIFTYKTDDFSNLQRQDYYLKSGFDNLKVENTEEGVRFFNNVGLNSKAFSENWFRNAAIKFNVNLEIRNFSQIGVAYLFGDF